MNKKTFSKRLPSIFIGLFLIAVACGAQFNWRIIVALIGINILLQAFLSTE